MHSIRLTLQVCFYLLICCLSPTGIVAQENPLERYIREGLESNLTLQSRKLDYEASLQALREARGLFFPMKHFDH